MREDEAASVCFECRNGGKAAGIARMLYAFMPYDSPVLLSLLSGDSAASLRQRFHENLSDVTEAVRRALRASTLIVAVEPRREQIPVELEEMDYSAPVLCTAALGVRRPYSRRSSRRPRKKSDVCALRCASLRHAREPAIPRVHFPEPC